MRLVAVCNKREAKDGQDDQEHVTELAALMPRVDITGVRLISQMVDSLVKPVAIGVDVSLVEVTELVHGVVLKVVHNDHVFFRGLRLVFEPVRGHDAR